MIDIMLKNDGDLYVSNAGDIHVGDSVLQQIRIKLQWFENEWKWNKDEGLPWFSILDKAPLLESFEYKVTEKIYEVNEVTSVKEVNISYNNMKRIATVFFVAETDTDTIKEEVKIRWPME